MSDDEGQPQGTSPAPAPPSDLGRHLRRRVPFYLLVVGLALLVMRYYQQQPSSVVVAYHLGAAGVGLERLEAIYRRGDEELHRVTFNFPADKSVAATVPEHGVRLPAGDFEVQVDLVYRGDVPSRIRRRSRPVSSRTVRMRRPLLVRGDGRVTIFIADEDR